MLKSVPHILERLRRFKLTPNRLWIGVFSIWSIFLTGILYGWGGGPGLLQRSKLKDLLFLKQAELARLESVVDQLEQEINVLEKSKIAQEREIRRVLGYAARDELIFDFSTSQSAALRQ